MKRAGLYLIIGLLHLVSWAGGSLFGAGNRLVHLEARDPFYVDHTFPKLTTPQWVGDEGVEAVVILAIDDLRNSIIYEAYMRPILDRLKEIDGRAPVSVFSNAVSPTEPRFQEWLGEGLSLEVHTEAHPCPLLAGNDFSKSLKNVYRCIDRLAAVPGNTPVAYRMPCCDSINSPSPRFYSEIFPRLSEQGRFLQIDSSVVNLFTSADPELPDEILVDGDGDPRFTKYTPFESFSTTIENYPYPYVFNRIGWEFPCAVPSDWQAQNLHGVNNPETVEDWKRCLDATVLKQGVMTWVFHPHGWIRSDQIVEWIDDAVNRYGDRVLFLTFPEALERINTHMLLGNPVRRSDGSDGGVRLLDLNDDGFLDVVIGSEKTRITRIWDPEKQSWNDTNLPVGFSGKPATYPGAVVEVKAVDENDGSINVCHAATDWDPGVRFGITSIGGHNQVFMVQSFLHENGEWMRGAWVWKNDDATWSARPELWNGWAGLNPPLYLSNKGTDAGFRFRDIDGDGISEALMGNPHSSLAWQWDEAGSVWVSSTWTLPDGTCIVDENGRDDGLRWVDLNNDGHDDVLHSNASQFSAHLYMPEWLLGWNQGWTRVTLSGIRGQSDNLEIPAISRGGEWPSNGAWFRNQTLWVQNEQTASLPDLVDRLPFKSILAGDLTSARTPGESMASMELHPDYVMELVAAEPLVQDPVAFDWGEDGALWVVEMRDYPSGLDGNGQAGGVIKRLVDLDGDGHFDTASIYLDGLNFPSGIKVWKKGAWISAAPDILWTEDTDGDGRADVIEKWATGFGEGNQQHRVNGFEWGLDGWLYIANGDSGGLITGRHQTDPIRLQGRDLRMHPITGELVAVQGQTQFGRRRDDWGNWFGNNNPNWLWHYIMPSENASMNPHVSFRSRVHMLAGGSEMAMAYPVSIQPQRFNVVGAPGHVTSANSPTPYRDDWFGPSMRNAIFISEPAQSLIRRFHLNQDGISFTASKVSEENQREFLAARDPWFRPTQLKIGPDGALYIADMYRLHIEHPQYIPDDVDNWTNFREGESLGRIYRIIPANSDHSGRPIVDRSQYNLSDWLDALKSPNGWVRDHAQARLIHTPEPDQELKSEAAAMYQSGIDARTRLHLMWVMLDWGMLDDAWIGKFLSDADPRVRSQAWSILSAWMSKSPDSKVDTEKCLSWVDADDALTLFAAVLALSGLDDDRFSSSPEAVWRVLMLTLLSRNDWILEESLLSAAAHPRWRWLMEAVVAEARHTNQPDITIRWRDWIGTGAFETSISSNDFSHVVMNLPGLADGSQSEASLSGMKILQEVLSVLAKLDDNHPKRRALVESSQFIDQVQKSLEVTLEQSSDVSLPTSQRSTAVGIFRLAHSIFNTAPEADELTQLADLIDPGQPAGVQSAVMELLLDQPGENGMAFIARHWTNMVPELKRRLLDAALESAPRAGDFLSQLKSGTIPPNQLSFFDRQAFLQSAWPDISERAQKIWSDTSVDSGNSSAAQWLEGSGDAGRGRQLFVQQCALCHQLRNEGASVGPNLDSFGTRPWSHFLEAVVRPGAAIDPAYQHVVVESVDGQVRSGVLKEISADRMTLISAGGQTFEIRDSDIDEMEFLPNSFMPEGLAEALGEQGLRDLWNYIQKPF